MIEFFVIKTKNCKPEYDQTGDICYSNLEKVWNQILTFSKDNKNSVSDYYILRLEATNIDEIIFCFWCAANGQRAKLKNYKILNVISIESK